MSAENLVGLILVGPAARLPRGGVHRPGEVLMSAAAWAQLALLVVLLGVSIPLLGSYMAKVYTGAKAPGDRVFLPVERLIYRICRVDPDREQRWTVYAFSVLAFSVVGLVMLYVMQRVQASLPFNPTNAPQVGEALSFNTATSFVTQHELAELLPRIDAEQPHPDGRPRGAELRVGGRRHGRDGRAHPRPHPPKVGDDRQLLGRPHPHDAAHPPARSRSSARWCYVSHGRGPEPPRLRGHEDRGRQHPGASRRAGGQPGSHQDARHQRWRVLQRERCSPAVQPQRALATCSGSSCILVIPFSLTYTYGKMVGDKKQGYVLLAVMVVIWLLVVGLTTMFELNGNPKLAQAGAEPGGHLDATGRQLRGQGHALRHARARRSGPRRRPVPRTAP